MGKAVSGQAVKKAHFAGCAIQHAQDGVSISNPLGLHSSIRLRGQHVDFMPTCCECVHDVAYTDLIASVAVGREICGNCQNAHR